MEARYRINLYMSILLDKNLTQVSPPIFALNALRKMTLFHLNKPKKTLSLLLFGGLFCGVMVGLLIGLTRDLPQIRSLESFTPSAVTRIYSTDRTLLAEIFLEKRHPVPLKMIPDHLKAV